MVAQRGEDGVRDRRRRRPAAWRRSGCARRSARRSGDRARPAPPAASATSGASRSHQPSTWETWIWLSPCVRGIWWLTSTKNGALPISAADVVGVRAEAEVAVAIGRAHRRDDQRALGRRAQEMRQLGEVVRDQVALPGPVRGSRDVREEVGDVTQVVAVLAVDRRPRMLRVHLVQAHAVELRVVGLERVDHADGLPVDRADDHVGAGLDVVEDRLRGDRAGLMASPSGSTRGRRRRTRRRCRA